MTNVRETEGSASPFPFSLKRGAWTRRAPDVPGFVSRRAMATLMGITRSALGYFERDGRLTPVRIACCIYYSQANVDAFREEYVPCPEEQRRRTKRKAFKQVMSQAKEGSLAAAVLRCLLDGKDLAHTVIETKATPEFVQQMWREMKTGFHGREEEKRRQENERLLVLLSKERVKRARLEHAEEMARLGVRPRPPWTPRTKKTA